MQRIRKHIPSPGLVVAVIALVAALAGTSYAALGLGKLKPGARDKTVGVGKLTYVTTTHTTAGANQNVSATCPSGLKPIGGGIKTTGVGDIHSSNLTPAGWAGRVSLAAGETANTTVACARSRVVRGAPPA